MDDNQTNDMPKEKCDVCGQEFATEGELDMHMQKEHPEEYSKLNQDPTTA